MQGGGATAIDGMGATLMPGLIDAHLHLSWNNAPGIDPIQMMELEEHMLVTMEMAKLVLDAGFTAGRGAAAAKPRLDVVAKRFINEGRFPGPRYLAAGPEITTVGGLGDSAPSHIPHEGLNLGIVVSGPEEVRRTVRQLIKYGVDSIKLNLSGEEITGMGAEETPMSEEEVAMAAKEAKCRNKVLAAHARSSGSVKQCVRHGIQNIYHASFADEEALDLLEAHKDQHFVAPGIAWLINTARHAEPWGIKPGSKVAMLYERELEMCIETMKKMHRRGIRIASAATTVLPGRRKAPTPRTSRPSSTCSASRRWRRCRPQPNMAARSWAWRTNWVWSAKAIWPTSCWSMAIRLPTSASFKIRPAFSPS
jgi:imidazolonepropionase-like amidohydrolase